MQALRGPDFLSFSGAVRTASGSGDDLLLGDVSQLAVGKAEMRQTVAKQSIEEDEHLVIELHADFTIKTETYKADVYSGCVPFILAIDGIPSETVIIVIEIVVVSGNIAIFLQVDKL